MIQKFGFLLVVPGIFLLCFQTGNILVNAGRVRAIYDTGIFAGEPIPIVSETVTIKNGSAKVSREYTYCTVNKNPSMKNDSVPLGNENVNIRGSVPDLIRNHGFDYIEYKVTTEDGYILTVFRLKFKGREPNNNGLPPVFLQHSFSASAAEWLMVDWPEALPYMLLRQGYDVYLGNSRGSEYSLGHKNPLMSNQLPKYWDFSVHELGKFDLPATFQFILKETGQPKLVYIGKGMGTTMFYICTSLNPEWNEKVELMVALSPVAYTNNTKSPLRVLSGITSLTKYFQLNGRLGNQVISSAVRAALPSLCNYNYTVFNPCESFLSFLYGSSPYEYSHKTYRRVFGHLPSSTSIRTLTHSLQHIKSGRFDQYDFGEAQNLIKYGRITPPEYDLGKVNVTQLNFYGRYDIVAVVKDTRKSLSQMPKTKGMSNYVVTSFSNHDYSFGRNAPYVVNTNLITFLENLLVKK